MILADTKFEFGELDGEIIVIDEMMTPDSSRYWPREQYGPGASPPSFDKQYVRDYMDSTGWDETARAAAARRGDREHARPKYVEAYELVTDARASPTGTASTIERPRSPSGGR